MERPPSGLRTDLTVTAGSVFRSGEEESRRVPVGGTAENAGVTWERVDAEDGGLRACPSVDRLAAPRLLDMVDLVGKIPEG
jgi:assimilatory nitrate reductase catalytic subunit